jgi:DNA polymerase III delta subunit
MKKIKKKNNALIKKRFLLARLHKSKIRIGKKALQHLIRLLQKNCLEFIEILERELIVKGKKTLTVSDIDSAYEKLMAREVAWEV